MEIPPTSKTINANDNRFSTEKNSAKFQYREKQREVARAVALTDPVRNGQRAVLGADATKAKRQHRKHRDETDRHRDNEVKIGTETINVNKPGIDDKRRCRRDARGENDANDNRIHVAIADRKTAKTGGLAKALPAQPGGTGKI